MLMPFAVFIVRFVALIATHHMILFVWWLFVIQTYAYGWLDSKCGCFWVEGGWERLPEVERECRSWMRLELPFVSSYIRLLCHRTRLKSILFSMVE